MFFEILWLDYAPLQNGFDAVFVALLRSTRTPFAMDKFTIQQVSRDAILLHVEDMPHPHEFVLDEDGFHAGGFSTVQDFKVGDTILLTYP